MPVRNAVAGLLSLLLGGSHAFLLPGMNPRDYPPGDKVAVNVNSLVSPKTQMHLDYYELPYCKPEAMEVSSETLGDALTGGRLLNSDFDVNMLLNVGCTIMCTNVAEGRAWARLKRAIQDDYQHTWVVDGLPAAAVILRPTGRGTYKPDGFPVGYVEDDVPYIFNHFGFTLLYHPVSRGGSSRFRVVGVRVFPLSVSKLQPSMTCSSAPPGSPGAESVANPLSFEQVSEPLKGYDGVSITFSYDVTWQESNIKWASRWDAYLSGYGADRTLSSQIHWFSIQNSLLVALCLSGIVAFILMRNLRRDISNIRDAKQNAMLSDDRGWRFVAKDVFRPPPQNKLLLCVIVGSGVQILFSVTATLFFAVVGFVNPRNRGSVLVGLILLYALSGSLAGYACARLYKTFRGTKWRRASALSAMLFPGLGVALFALLEGVEVGNRSSDVKHPFLATAIVFAVWMLVYVPLNFCGAYLGYAKPAFEYPSETNRIARRIPPQPWYLNGFVAYPLVGILPFAAIFVELFFIMGSVWMGQTFYVFSFLVLAFLLMVVMCAEGAIVIVYISLCYENYNWWYRAILGPATTGLYVFAYSILYFRRLGANSYVTYFLYFGYMAIACGAVSLMAGCVGFFACLWFVRYMYGAIKAA